MRPADRITVRIALWTLVVCVSHAAATALLFGAVIALWFLFGGPYDSKPLQAGFVAALCLPFLSDYPLAKRIMDSSRLKKIAARQRI